MADKFLYEEYDVGIPFYNNEDENKFKQSLYEVIEN